MARRMSMSQIQNMTNSRSQRVGQNMNTSASKSTDISMRMSGVGVILGV